MYRRLIKPLCDRIAAFILLVLLSPLLCVVALLIWITTRKSPFFLQRRPGLNNRIFTIYKFKTMNDNRDKDGNLLPDDERLTWIGNIVRLTSIDELPQLLNVVKGDMSLIGPRPWLPRQVSRFSPHRQEVRGSVRPGITGLAQCMGRSSLPRAKRLSYDLWYARHVSLKTDLFIFFRSIYKVIKHDDVKPVMDPSQTNED